jgi:hypothetical protein
MVDMMQTNIACKPLQYFGQLVIRTPSQRRYLIPDIIGAAQDSQPESNLIK